MFERYTEKARRVIFFARYEASNYGSRSIESGHLLLGLLREDRALTKLFLGSANGEPEIRAEIESRITRGDPISTAVEVPLTEECKRILNFAGEEADRLGHHDIRTEHLLLGILRMEGSLAGQVLMARGLKPSEIRAQCIVVPSPRDVNTVKTNAYSRLEGFLAGLNWLNSEELIPFFAHRAQFIDASGKKWNHEEICKGFESIFAPYAKKNTTYMVDEMQAERNDLFVGYVLWKNALLASEQRGWIHRMSIVLIPEDGDWEILLAQVTPVKTS